MPLKAHSNESHKKTLHFESELFGGVAVLIACELNEEIKIIKLK